MFSLKNFKLVNKLKNTKTQFGWLSFSNKNKIKKNDFMSSIIADNKFVEEDLKLRGPGDINGIQQSGYFTLGIADPINDKDIMEMARDDILAEN